MDFYWHFPSVVLYYIVILLTVIFAFLSQYKYLLNAEINEEQSSILINGKMFLLIAFLIPWAVSSFRYGVGMDFYAYNVIYQEAEQLLSDFILLKSIEPGYLALNLLVKFISKNNDQALFIVSSFIMLSFVFASIKFQREKIYVSLAVLVFMCLFYLQSFNIIRLYLAVAIILYSLRFITSRNLVKYSLLILLACSFHYSAIVLWPFYFLQSRKACKGNILIKIGLYLTTIVIFCFGFSKLLPMMQLTKYSIYDVKNFNIGDIPFLKLPILLLVLINRKKLINYNHYNQIYSELVIYEFFLNLFVARIEVFGRILIYFSIPYIMLLAALPKVFKGYKRVLMILFIVFYSLAYFYVFHIVSYWEADGTLPYRTIFEWMPDF